MSALNLNQARVIDPVLTGYAQGYKHVARVGSVLFPTIPVLNRGGKIIEFGKESFRNYNARRAPGADTQMIQFGYEGKPFALSQFAMDAPVPREFMQDAENVPGVDLGKRAVKTVLDSLMLTLEIDQGKLATNPESFEGSNKLALTGADRWDVDASDPIKDIDDAKDQVRTTCGVEPNKMVIGKPVFKALKNHPKIVERFKYTSSESITADMLSGLFDLDELAVGKATHFEGTDEDGSFKEIWGNKATLAYVPSNAEGMEEPSFGYTYTLLGHPFVEKPDWRGSKKSWIYGVTYEREPVVTGIASGFLFTSVTGE